MLYDGALMSIREAMQHMDAARIAERGRAISRAISIIDGGLKASLDLRRGGEIAGWLDQLYDYMNRRLVGVSLRDDPTGLVEVDGLLRELRGAWAEIANKSLSSAVPAQHLAA
jgi:flagellar protein FliS